MNAELPELPPVLSLGPPRLTAGLDTAERLDRRAHLAVHGSVPQLPDDRLVLLAETIALRGRGADAAVQCRDLCPTRPRRPPGAEGYAGTGTAAEPGTLLLTLSGAVPRPSVVEAPGGVPMRQVLGSCGADPGFQGVLVGGYHGGWLDAMTAVEAVLGREALAARGGSLGAVLPQGGRHLPAGRDGAGGALAGRRVGRAVRALPAGAALAGRGAGGPGGRRRTTGTGDRVGGGPGGARTRCLRAPGRGGALGTQRPDGVHRRPGRACARQRLRTAGMLPLPAPSGAESSAGERPAVDWTLCEGHGLCADLLPELVRMGPDGYPSLADARVPGQLRGRAQRAIRRCPALALRLDRER